MLEYRRRHHHHCRHRIVKKKNLHFSTDSHAFKCVHSFNKIHLLLLVFCNFDHLPNQLKKYNLNCVYGRYMLLPIIFIASKCLTTARSTLQIVCKTLSIQFSSTRSSFIGWPTTIFRKNSKYAIKHLHSKRFVSIFIFSIHLMNTLLRDAFSFWENLHIFNMNFFF